MKARRQCGSCQGPADGSPVQKTAVLLPLLSGIFSSATLKRTEGVPDPDFKGQGSQLHAFLCALISQVLGPGWGGGGLAGGLGGGWVSRAGLQCRLLEAAGFSGKGALFSQAAPPSLSQSGWAPSSRLKGFVSE